ncbi:hypothetical protein Q3G72_014270 [Acer saccharum]|nr:hypothetical protein Q3G72_014270 [Acer saccharum]
MSEHIEGAILYLDSRCTESFQYMGAFPVLLDLGARAVCSLENMSSLDSHTKNRSLESPLSVHLPFGDLVIGFIFEIFSLLSI